MKYFYSEKISNIKNCSGGKFVVSIPFGEPDRLGYVKTKKHLMDNLGIISDAGYDDLSLEADSLVMEDDRDDGLYVARIDGEKFLIDSNEHTLAMGFKSVSHFNESGLALIEYEKRGFWINREGAIFGSQFEDVSYFEDGFAPAKLKSGKWVLVDEKFNIVEDRFDYIFHSGCKNYFLAGKDDEKFIVDRNFKIVGKVPSSVFSVSDYGYAVGYAPKEEGKLSFALYRVNGEHIMNAKLINPTNDKMMRFYNNGRAWFFNQETGKIIGGKDGFFSADFFSGEMAAVCLGLDERDEGIFTFIREDGSMFGGTYESAHMVDKNLGAAYIPNEKGTSGKFHLVDKDGNIGDKGFRRLGSFYDGIATFESRRDVTWSFVDKYQRRFKGDYDSVSRFSGGFSVVEKDGKCDVIDRAEVSLRTVSEFVKKIENNPLEFLNMPEEFECDRELVQRLHTFALSVLDEKLEDAMDEEKKQKYQHGKKSIAEKCELLLKNCKGKIRR